LVAAPGALRDVELVVLGWRTEDGETALICRLVDGSSGTIPARWTDLPSRGVVEPRLGTVATPEAWRLWGERLAGLLERCPGRGRACRENGGGDVRSVGAGDERDGRAGGGVGDLFFEHFLAGRTWADAFRHTRASTGTFSTSFRCWMDGDEVQPLGE
jgi:hypothetical protein